jgi:hypothetical protein
VAEYRSPRFGTAAAATTPARLREQFDNVLWRELPDGGIEVAARRKDHLERVRVNEEGGVSHVATVALPSKRRQRHKLLESHLGRREEWHEPTDLKGWTPRTSAQLAAVEEIADEHGGLALVRDVGAATIEVCAPCRGALDYYVIHGDGTAERRPNPSRRQQRWPRRLMIAGSLALFLGFTALGSAFGNVAHWLGMALGVTAVAWLWQQTAEARLQRRDPTWIEIRTFIDDSD